MITINRPLYESLSNICTYKSLLFSNEENIQLKTNLKQNENHENRESKLINKFSLEKNKFLNFLKFASAQKSKDKKPKRFLLVNSNKEINLKISETFISKTNNNIFNNKILAETKYPLKRKIQNSQKHFYNKNKEDNKSYKESKENKDNNDDIYYNKDNKDYLKDDNDYSNDYSDYYNIEKKAIFSKCVRRENEIKIEKDKNKDKDNDKENKKIFLMLENKYKYRNIFKDKSKDKSCDDNNDKSKSNPIIKRKNFTRFIKNDFNENKNNNFLRYLKDKENYKNTDYTFIDKDTDKDENIKDLSNGLNAIKNNKIINSINSKNKLTEKNKETVRGIEKEKEKLNKVISLYKNTNENLLQVNNKDLFKKDLDYLKLKKKHISHNLEKIFKKKFYFHSNENYNNNSNNYSSLNSIDSINIIYDNNNSINKKPRSIIYLSDSNSDDHINFDFGLFDFKDFKNKNNNDNNNNDNNNNYKKINETKYQNKKNKEENKNNENSNYSIIKNGNDENSNNNNKNNNKTSVYINRTKSHQPYNLLKNKIINVNTK